jgi:hypothetical protein
VLHGIRQPRAPHAHRSDPPLEVAHARSESFRFHNHKLRQFAGEPYPGRAQTHPRPRWLPCLDICCDLLHAHCPEAISRYWLVGPSNSNSPFSPLGGPSSRFKPSYRFLHGAGRWAEMGLGGRVANASRSELHGDPLTLRYLRASAHPRSRSARAPAPRHLDCRNVRRLAGHTRDSGRAPRRARGR